MHRACKSGSGLRVLNCLCCTVLQVDTIVIYVVRGDCAIRFFFLSVLLILAHACGQGNPIQLRCGIGSSLEALDHMQWLLETSSSHLNIVPISIFNYVLERWV